MSSFGNSLREIIRIKISVYNCQKEICVDAGIDTDFRNSAISHTEKNPETVDNRHNRRILEYRFTQSGIFCIYRHFIYFNIFISQQD